MACPQPPTTKSIAVGRGHSRDADLLFSNNHTAAGLMGGQYQHFGNLHMRWSISRIDSNVGNVVASQRLDALIDVGGTLVIAMETDGAEVGLD